MNRFDVAIIGGGIIGLATAYELVQRYPGRRVVILEKEDGVAGHQTGHNSGVLHSGIYYRPGSLKATNCRDGKVAMEAFCQAEGIAYESCGKVIVAVRDDEIPRLQKIYERGRANGVRCELIDRARLEELEPHAAGIQAILVPEAGIVDYTQVAQRLAQIIEQHGGQILTKSRVRRMLSRPDEIILETTVGAVKSQHVVNCAGLYSDRVTRMSGQRPQARIIPFRGEFYALRPEAHHLCNTMIYPVPDPGFPFLGVHLTRVIGGGVHCGPNAVLALAREGYRKRDANLIDLLDTLTYSGFLRLSLKYWRIGATEMWRSISKRAFVKAVQRLVPDLRPEHLETAPSGVRAQAVAPDGNMVDDFLIQTSDRVVNVCNAPSPAATASLNIGRLIVDRLAEQMA